MIGNGSFNIRSSTHVNTGLVIDTTSIRAYSAGTPTVTIDTDGMFTIVDGKFSMKTAGSESNGIEIDATGIRINKDGDTKFEANASGSINIKDTFTISSQTAANKGRFQIDQRFIRGYKGDGSLSFKLDAEDGSISMGSPYLSALRVLRVMVLHIMLVHAL